MGGTAAHQRRRSIYGAQSRQAAGQFEAGSVERHRPNQAEAAGSANAAPPIVRREQHDESVMPGPDPGIHRKGLLSSRGWIAGSSPAMTIAPCHSGSGMNSF